MNSKEEKLRKQIIAIGKIRKNSELLITTNNEVEVCNGKGSNLRSPDCPNCGSWKHHWERLTRKQWPQICSNSKCANLATDGGHVVFADNRKGRKYIIPLCSSCNGKSPDEKYTIDVGTVMISANCSETCDKMKLEEDE